MNNTMNHPANIHIPITSTTIVRMYNTNVDKMHTQGSSKQDNNKTELSTHHNGRRGDCITTEAIMYQYFIALSFPRAISTSSD